MNDRDWQDVCEVQLGERWPAWQPSEIDKADYREALRGELHDVVCEAIRRFRMTYQGAFNMPKLCGILEEMRAVKVERHQQILRDEASWKTNRVDDVNPDEWDARIKAEADQARADLSRLEPEEIEAIRGELIQRYHLLQPGTVIGLDPMTWDDGPALMTVAYLEHRADPTPTATP